MALQEVQRRQATALAAALSTSSRRWVFKHWPVVARAEGLAVLTPAPSAEHGVVRRCGRAPFWDWRRRIGLEATVGSLVVPSASSSSTCHHMTKANAAGARPPPRSAGRPVTSPLPMIVGDLNDLPADAAHHTFVDAGWVDAWQSVHGDEVGSTNWTPGDRRVARPPSASTTCWLRPARHVEQCSVLADDRRFDELARLSDHLPLAATIRLLGAP